MTQLRLLFGKESDSQKSARFSLHFRYLTMNIGFNGLALALRAKG